PLISVVPRLSVRPPVSKLKTSSLIWLTGPGKTAMPCSASSTATSATRKVQHEALFRVTPPSRSICDQLGSRWDLPGPGGSGPISLAQAEALLRDPLRGPEAQTSDRMLHDRTPLL